MWTPSATRNYDLRCQQFMVQPLTAELVTEMRHSLAFARRQHAQQGFRALRQCEIDMEVMSMRRIQDLADCIAFAEATLQQRIADATPAPRRTCRCTGCSGRC